MTNELDLTKPMQTRDGGYDAEHIYTFSNEGLLFAIKNADGKEGVVERLADGRVYDNTDDKMDIINAPQETVVWMNLYERGEVSRHYNKEVADAYHEECGYRIGQRIACARFVLKEGVWDD
jgi:hypothetical protein